MQTIITGGRAAMKSTLYRAFSLRTIDGHKPSRKERRIMRKTKKMLEKFIETNSSEIATMLETGFINEIINGETATAYCINRGINPLSKIDKLQSELEELESENSCYCHLHPPCDFCIRKSNIEHEIEELQSSIKVEKEIEKCKH